MSRGIGEFGPIQDLLPEWAVVIVALLTQLGDAWFLITLLAVLYWTQADTQDDIILVGGILAAGVGLYRGLKFLFAFPRPEQPPLDPELLPWIIRPLYQLTAHASGYGFPSGHATMSTIAYFGLAAILPYSTRHRRFAVAGLAVATVGFSRVALGVHFLVDIIAGVLLGGLLLVVAFRLLEEIPQDRVSVVLGAAIVLNGFYVFTSDLHTEAVIMVGIALGLFGGWQLILLARELVLVDRPSAGVRPAVIRLTLAAVTLAPLGLALEVFPILSGEPYPIAGLAGIAIAVIIIVPIARYSSRARRVFAGVSFWLQATLWGIRLALRPTTWRRAIEAVRQFIDRKRH